MRDLEHLRLTVWQEPLRRRKHGGGRPPHRDAPLKHAQKLVDEAETLSQTLETRKARAPQGINPKLIFRLVLHPQGNLEDEAVEALGLRVLGKQPHEAIVVFPDEPALAELNSRLRQHAGLDEGHAYGGLTAIESIEPLRPEEKIGSRLRARPLTGDEADQTPLDVELWHAGDQAECRAWIGEIEQFLTQRGCRVSDRYLGDSLCLLRVWVDNGTLDALIASDALDYIKEIDRRPEPAFEMLEVVRSELGQFPPIQDVPANAAGVVVVDSGVMQGHPLLAPAIQDAQVFAGRLLANDNTGASDGDTTTGGHGTAVAGVAVYNDIGECLAQQRFEPGVALFSARVTDPNNEYDPEDLLENQLARAIQYFLDNYATAKVFNLSLGDVRLVYSQGRQFRVAAAIDELAYGHREREVVFVVSSGNLIGSSFGERTDEQIAADYPGYLVDGAQTGLVDPATAAIALTVGGLSYGTGRAIRNRVGDDVAGVLAPERGWPSPFTRTGPGVDGAIKPDFVDYAGTWRAERGRIPDQAAHAGLPTTAKDFAPPEGRLLRSVAGTSFSAPRVANTAARLFEQFPTASSNLVRALLASSARVPAGRPPGLAGLADDDESVLRVYGYGQPDYDVARRSAENDVWMLDEGSMAPDTLQLYEIPELPPGFLSATGSGTIGVALAFDPPTRSTRGDSYLGITMEFALYRNSTAQSIANAWREYSNEEKKRFCERLSLLSDDEKKRSCLQLPSLSDLKGTQKLDLAPGTNARKKGTLQRGRCRVRNSAWKYDQGALVLAVVCRRHWAPIEVDEQRYAVVVTYTHENSEVQLYSHVRQHLRVYQRVRVQA